ncbi:chloride channel protein [Pseudobutyrivibrio xylanivorans]|uniref:Chloride channel protein n=1 Tax=Pseudobutyrivibrio xylanivorans TaxID=185007 RepID=A0A5P6VVT2_PSEXY|nr:chloride channel protein [Pseudobutyrivibrio xylanivorans]QFJ55824.1 chloride channel protein [Pseudobutyrivibrio xylanivorans]
MFNEEFKEKAIHKIDHNGHRALSVVTWTIASILVGLSVGAFASAFGLSMKWVIKTREANPWLIFFLPVGAVLITYIYKTILKVKDSGTNTVIAAIQSDERLPFRLAPLIFIATLITHLVGGSAGREGAALQMGGAIGNGIGRALKLNSTDKKTMIMCGMSAAFSALFGTPMAAAIFSMEVISVGIMHYAALVPCVISSLVARSVATHMGLGTEMYVIGTIPKFGVVNGILISVFAVICGFVSILFCMSLHKYEEFLSSKLENPYIKAVVGGCSVLVLTLLVGSQTYNSTGSAIIESCFTGATIGLKYFLLKIIFTTLTLSCGYKGGEIVPTLFIGATLGAAMGPILGMPSPLLAAVGMGALFCGVTNCPISSLLICFELFGYEPMPYFLLAVAFSYWVSGYTGLYKSQKIVYSKYKSNFINKKVE